MGFKGINTQQGTTRAIYDAVKLLATPNVSTIRFFENVNTKKFPFANLTENKLQVGESITFQRMSLSVMEYDSVSGRVEAIVPLDYFFEFQGLYRSDLSISIAQDQVVKKLPMHTLYAPFNKNSKFLGNKIIGAQGTTTSFGLPHDVLHFDNPIVLPPQIEFYADLQLPTIQLPTVAVGVEFYMVMTLEGLGSLYAPKSTY